MLIKLLQAIIEYLRLREWNRIDPSWRYEVVITDAQERYLHQVNGWWYFADETEQLNGPFANKREAALALNSYEVR